MRYPAFKRLITHAPSGVLLPAVRRVADAAPRRAPRALGRGWETQRDEIATPDPVHRPDPGGSGGSLRSRHRIAFAPSDRSGISGRFSSSSHDTHDEAVGRANSRSSRVMAPRNSGESCRVFKQGSALHQFRSNEQCSFVLPDLVHGKNVRVVRRRGCSGLALESLQYLLVSGKFVGQKLQSHLAPQLNILGLVHDAHTTATDPLHDAVVGDGLADQ